MSILITSLAAALVFLVLFWWLHGMYATARDNFLLNRQQKVIRRLEKENARLYALFAPEEDSN